MYFRLYLYFRRNDQISAPLDFFGTKQVLGISGPRALNKLRWEEKGGDYLDLSQAVTTPHHTLPGNWGERLGQTGWRFRRSTRDRQRQRRLHHWHSSSILTINNLQLLKLLQHPPPPPELCGCSWQFFTILNLFVIFHKESFYSISWHYCQFSELSIFGSIFCIDKNITMDWVEGQFERSWSFLNIRFGCFWIFR